MDAWHFFFVLFFSPIQPQLRCTMLMKSYLYSILLLSMISSITHAQKPVVKTRKSDLVEVMVDAANSRFFYFSSATRPFWYGQP